MSQENVEIMRRVVEAFNCGGPEAAAAFFDPESEWHDAPDQPDAEVHRGPTGYIAAMERFFGEFENYSCYLDKAIKHGDEVVLWLRVIGQGRSSGARFEQRAVGVSTLRNGLIVRVVWFGTREEEALEAVGLSEQDAHADS
jgi:ketosteroid isomerase-like protein